VKFTSTTLPQVLKIEPKQIGDDRGTFIKMYNEELYRLAGISMPFGELFFSTSKKDVLRGFHFQNPPYGLEKLVWVIQGEILDVVIDLRKESTTYGKCYAEYLSATTSTALYMPEGTGHAFLCLSQECCVMYCTSRVFSPGDDTGIRWDSVGFNWPVQSPVLSAKDKNLPDFRDWVSPF